MITRLEAGERGPVPTSSISEIPTQELDREIHRLAYWRHRIDLGNGRVTPGTRDKRYYDALGLGDLHGKSVLDVGAWDGLFSFEAERHGAARVLATDVWSAPPEDPQYWQAVRPGSTGFVLAKTALRSSVEYKELSVYDLSSAAVGEFDVVLFLGVLYHLRDPYLALRRVADVTKGTAVVESHVARVLTRAPVMRFYAGRDLSENPSNWWGPNVECLRRMLLSVGFRTVDVQATQVGVETPKLPVGFVRKGPHALLRFPPGEAGETASVPGRSACFILAETTWKGTPWYRVEASVHGNRVQGYLPPDAVTRLGPQAGYALQWARSLWGSSAGRRATLVARK